MSQCPCPAVWPEGPQNSEEIPGNFKNETARFKFLCNVEGTTEKVFKFHAPGVVFTAHDFKNNFRMGPISWMFVPDKPF